MNNKVATLFFGGETAVAPATETANFIFKDGNNFVFYDTNNFIFKKEV